MSEEQMASAQISKEEDPMDEARLVINLKEGIVELQGPPDFVRHCLDMYQPAIQGLLGLPSEAAAKPEKTKSLPRQRRVPAPTKARKGRLTSCMGFIRSDLEAGFFDKPRSTNEIKQRLSGAGLSFTENGVRANLRRLSLSGALDVVRKGRSVRYQRRGQS
jgi:hypothetical protein